AYGKKLTPRGVTTKLRLISSAPASVVSTENRYIEAAAEAMEQVFKKKTVYMRSGGSISIAALLYDHLYIPVVIMSFSLSDDNLTRTAASVGEALVAGAIFTIPAFMMVNVGGVRLWQDLRSHFWVGTLILLAGGLLGVFFIIILRRPLCVESTDLPFPESTA